MASSAEAHGGLDGLGLPPGPGWLQELRGQAQAALAESGLPESSWEHWRHSRSSALYGRQLVSPECSGDPEQGLARLDELLADACACRLVFIDGFLDVQRSSCPSLPAGVSISRMGGAHADGGGADGRADGGAIEGQCAALASRIELHSNPLTALNTALLRDFVHIQVSPNVQVAEPVLVVSYSTSAAVRRLACPRVQVDLAEGARLQLVEWHSGAAGVEYTSVPVSEISVARQAELGVARISEEGDQGHQLGVVSINAAADAEVAVHSFVRGGAQVRLEMNAWLDGAGGNVSLSGFHFGTERHYVEHHTAVHHRSESSTSRQFFQGLLSGRAESLFDGLVHVQPGAQQTDAEQQNRNLLLSPMALAHSVPRLEIYADDVRCSHGATAGQLDEQALFYMRARGIAPETAQALLCKAFAAEAIDRSPVAAAREYELRSLDSFLALDSEQPQSLHAAVSDQPLHDE